MQIEIFIGIFFVTVLALGKFVDWLERKWKFSRELEKAHQRFVDRRGR